MISLYPKYWKRYKDIALLLIRHQQRELVSFLGLDRVFENGKPPKGPPKQVEAREVVADLEKLGPTFVKLGQLLSTRTDMLPDEYLQALSRLQDQVTPLSIQTIESILREEFNREPITLFASFEKKPLASASLGQVHRARLWTGEDVVVKIQRPNIREEIYMDLEVLGQLADFLDHNTQIGHRYRFSRMLFSLRRSLLQEVDYRIEAENALRYGKNLKDFERILIPKPFKEFTTSKVLTLQYVEGIKLTDLQPAHIKGLDGESLAREFFQCYMHQVLVDGFFHADPHPGNIFITPDLRIALIDFGMVVNVPDNVVHGMIKLILALTAGHGDEVASVAIELGREEKNFDASLFRERVRHLVADLSYTPVGNIQTGHIVMDMQGIAGECNLLLPSELTMFGKVLMNLDKLVKILCPTMIPRKEMQQYSMTVVQHRSMAMMTLDRIYKSLLETGELTQALPYRLNKFTEMLAENRVKLRVQAFDEKKMLSGMDKIANRVTTGWFFGK